MHTCPCSAGFWPCDASSWAVGPTPCIIRPPVPALSAVATAAIVALGMPTARMANASVRSVSAASSCSGIGMPAACVSLSLSHKSIMQQFFVVLPIHCRQVPVQGQREAEGERLSSWLAGAGSECTRLTFSSCGVPAHFSLQCLVHGEYCPQTKTFFCKAGEA